MKWGAEGLKEEALPGRGLGAAVVSAALLTLASTPPHKGWVLPYVQGPLLHASQPSSGEAGCLK